MRQGHVGGVNLAQRARLGSIDHAVLLPAAHAHHLVARFEFGVLGLDHLAHRATNHHLAQPLRCSVALAVVHAAAHVGIQAQEVVLDKHLAIFQRRGVGGDQLEVVSGCFALRAVVEHDLLVAWHGDISWVGI